MIIHSSNFLIRQIAVSKHPFYGNNDPFSINSAVMQDKIPEKKHYQFFNFFTRHGRFNTVAEHF